MQLKTEILKHKVRYLLHVSKYLKFHILYFYMFDLSFEDISLKVIHTPNI